jgi:hypothetical protein
MSIAHIGSTTFFLVALAIAVIALVKTLEGPRT